MHAKYTLLIPLPLTLTLTYTLLTPPLPYNSAVTTLHIPPSSLMDLYTRSLRLTPAPVRQVGCPADDDARGIEVRPLPRLSHQSQFQSQSSVSASFLYMQTQHVQSYRLLTLTLTLTHVRSYRVYLPLSAILSHTTSPAHTHAHTHTLTHTHTYTPPPRD